jgi:hypothetical protein
VRNDLANVATPVYYNTSTNELTYASTGLTVQGEPQTAPVLSNFTWFNQGSATATQRAGYISMLGDASTNARFLGQAVPSLATTWSATMRFKYTAFDATNSRVGIMLYDNSSGKAESIDIFAASNQTDTDIEIVQWSSLASATTGIGPSVFLNDYPDWMRISWDGAGHANWQVSVDGYSWVSIYSNTVTSYMTPTHVGFFSQGGSAVLNMSILSWSVG